MVVCCAGGSYEATARIASPPPRHSGLLPSKRQTPRPHIAGKLSMPVWCVRQSPASPMFCAVLRLHQLLPPRPPRLSLRTLVAILLPPPRRAPARLFASPAPPRPRPQPLFNLLKRSASTRKSGGLSLDICHWPMSLAFSRRLIYSCSRRAAEEHHVLTRRLDCEHENKQDSCHGGSRRYGVSGYRVAAPRPDGANCQDGRPR
jgi:hypothetical protein